MKLFQIFLILFAFISCESEPYVSQDCASRCRPHPYVLRSIIFKSGRQLEVCLCRDASGKLDFPSEFVSGKQIPK